MADLGPLLAAAGNWRGSNNLWLDADAPPAASASDLRVVPVLAGRFVRLDQTWAHDGNPQEGSLLIGLDGGVASGHYVDTLHTGRRAMAFAGDVRDGGTVVLHGSYPAPPGPDWGWRIEVSAVPGQRVTVAMFNLHPNGQADRAVLAEFTPA